MECVVKDDVFKAITSVEDAVEMSSIVSRLTGSAQHLILYTLYYCHVSKVCIHDKHIITITECIHGNQITNKFKGEQTLNNDKLNILWHFPAISQTIQNYKQSIYPHCYGSCSSPCSAAHLPAIHTVKSKTVNESPSSQLNNAEYAFREVIFYLEWVHTFLKHYHKGYSLQFFLQMVMNDITISTLVMNNILNITIVHVMQM